MDGLQVDAPPFSEDGFPAAEVDVSWGQVADALVVAVVVIVVDEGGDGGFEFPFEEVVLEQDSVFEGLVPALNLSLGLGMHRRAADVLHAFVLAVFGEIFGDVGRAVIAEKSRLVPDFGIVAARGGQGDIEGVRVTLPPPPNPV